MGDAGAGAAAGAVAARGQSRRQNAAQAQQQPATQQDQAGVAAYQKARSACLEGRGYTVKYDCCKPKAPSTARMMS